METYSPELSDSTMTFRDRLALDRKVRRDREGMAAFPSVFAASKPTRLVRCAIVQMHHR